MVLTSKDVEKQWQKKVKERAKEQEVTEDEVIRYGLAYDFKAEKERNEIGKEQKESRKNSKDEFKALVDESKEQTKILRDILKELKKP